MKLEQLLTERAMTKLFHLTGMINAVEILQTGQFKLSTSTGTRDRARVPGATWKVDHYFLSMSRSIQSEYFHDMLGYTEVILVIAGDKLTQRNRIRPHADKEANELFGDEYNEMEERLRSDKPVLPIPKPINQTILSIHCMDILDPHVVQGNSRRMESDRGSADALTQLRAVCAQLNVPLITYKDFNRFKLLRQ